MPTFNSRVRLQSLQQALAKEACWRRPPPVTVASAAESAIPMPAAAPDSAPALMPKGPLRLTDDQLAAVLHAAEHSIRPAVMAPDCETRASAPAGGMRAAKLALSLARDDNTPRQFGPTSLRPVARAAFSQASASEPSPWPSPAVMMMAVAAPCSPAAAMMPGTGLWRCRDDEQIGRRSQLLDGFDGFDSLDLAIVRVDETDRSSETGAVKVSQHGTAGRRFAWARPHDHDRSRREQLVETIGRHRSHPSNGGSRPLPQQC
jgi:hypothetical protein